MNTGSYFERQKCKLKKLAKHGFRFPTSVAYLAFAIPTLDTNITEFRQNIVKVIHPYNSEIVRELKKLKNSCNTPEHMIDFLKHISINIFQGNQVHKFSYPQQRQK